MEGNGVKITRIETVPVDRHLFVRVQTDAGIVGLGESGAWGYLEASEQIIQKVARYPYKMREIATKLPFDGSVDDF